MIPCPNCGSSNTRRGGRTVWTVYLALIAAAVPAVLVWRLNGAIVGALLIVAVIAVNLLARELICRECGNQWRAG